MADDADWASEMEERERRALIERARRLFGRRPAPPVPPREDEDQAS